MGAPDGESTAAHGSAAAGHAVTAAPPPIPLPRAAEPPPVAVDPAPDGASSRPRTHRWGLGAYLLVEAVFIGVSLLIGHTYLVDRDSAGPLVLALTVPTVLAAATAVLITRLRGNGPRADLGLVWSWHDVRVGAAYGLGGLMVSLPASVVYVAVVGPERASSAIGNVFAGLHAGPLAALAVALVVVLVAPVCEEIVYRGLLWGAVERYAPPRWVPFAVTTVLFALAHFELTRTPLLLVVALPIALARLRTGRLVASIVAHQLNNLLPGVVLALTLVGVAPL